MNRVAIFFLAPVPAAIIGGFVSWGTGAHPRGVSIAVFYLLEFYVLQLFFGLAIRAWLRRTGRTSVTSFAFGGAVMVAVAAVPFLLWASVKPESSVARAAQVLILWVALGAITGMTAWAIERRRDRLCAAEGALKDGGPVDETPSATAIAHSPIGAVTLSVSGPSTATIKLRQVEIPDLPNGMAVDGVMMFRITTDTRVSTQAPLILSVAAEQDGDSATGEWLESMSFCNDAGEMHVAMRDTEWLSGNGIAAEYAGYWARGFRQVITEAPAGTALYVTLAWRLGENAATADDASTWFAADLAIPDWPNSAPPTGKPLPDLAI